MLTVADASGIVEVVAKDPESKKRISSKIDEVVPASWGLAGSLRNSGYVALYMVTLGNYGDPTDSEFADRVCTGIADATAMAIIAAVKKGVPLVRRVKKATTVSRVHWGVDHTATAVTMVDGQTHVFDWHATLDEKNPMLYRSVADWSEASGGITLEDFSGFD